MTDINTCRLTDRHEPRSVSATTPSDLSSAMWDISTRKGILSVLSSLSMGVVTKGWQDRENTLPSRNIPQLLPEPFTPIITRMPWAEHGMTVINARHDRPCHLLIPSHHRPSWILRPRRSDAFYTTLFRQTCSNEAALNNVTNPNSASSSSYPFINRMTERICSTNEYMSDSKSTVGLKVNKINTTQFIEHIAHAFDSCRNRR